MHSALGRVDHRPWALPAGAWTWRQSWRDLLFAHWPVPASLLRPLIPPALSVQTFDGTSWIGVVPFRMEGVMRRPLPDLPGLSAFAELNVRCYVECDGRPGVWFFSLDATNALAVWAARRFFHLPYFRADIDVRLEGETVRYRSRRRDMRGPAAVFEGTYAPVSPPYEASCGTLEHWLTERYCLYALTPSGRLLRSEVHHHPWPLQRADADITRNSMWQGLPPDRPTLLHFAKRLDVVVWSPAQVGSA